MGKRGRKSQADVMAAAQVVELPQRDISAPSHLDGRALEIFEETVRTAGAEHFVQSDSQLLANYAQAVALFEEASQQVAEGGAVKGSNPSPWYKILEKQSKLISTLSMRLRLSPHSRYDARAAQRKTQARGTAPINWKQAMSDD